MKLLKVLSIVTLVVFFPGMIAVLFGLAFPYDEAGHKIEPFNDHPQYYGIHTHSGSYEPGKVGDFNNDGKKDFISSYGCAFISGARAESNVSGCEMSKQDSDKQTTFPAALAHELDLKPEQIAEFKQYPGQQFMQFSEIGSKYFTMPGKEDSVAHPLFEPLYYENYLEKLEGKTNIVIEYGLTEVQRFEIQSDGSVVEKEPTQQQRLKALGNWHNHVEKGFYFPTIFYVLMSFVVAVAAVIVLVIMGIVKLAKKAILKNKVAPNKKEEKKGKVKK